MTSKIKIELPDAVLITLGQCAEILGLTYHTARNLLSKEGIMTKFHEEKRGK